jgi:glycerophosphoryl diester phosphodiesterase
MRDPTSGSPAQPVAFLDDVTAIVAENDFGDGFVLQLDLKARKPSSRSIERFTELIAPIASHCILSGADWDDVRKLSRSIDGLRLGYDPIDMLVAALPGVLETPESTIAFAKSALTVAPEADWIYLYHKLVTAALDAGVDLIAEAHALGQKVDVWTIDPDDAAAPKSVERLVELGVDQITTNAAVDWLKWWAAR